MTTLHSFDEESIRIIKDEVGRLRNEVHNLQAELSAVRSSAAGGSKPFMGKTTTNAAHPSYPGSGCQFVVQRIDNHWDETATGSCASQDVAVGQYIIGRTIDGMHLPEDTAVMAIPIPGSHGGRWYILKHPTVSPTTPSDLEYAVADAALVPGDTTGVAFSKQSWSSGWSDSGSNITVKDYAGNNCYLTGESGWFITPDGGTTYMPVGSHGLLRFANADADIAVDASGAGKLWENKTKATAITISNTYEGYKRALINDFSDDCVVVYDPTQSLWIALPPWVAMFAVGKLNGVQTATGSEQPIDNWSLYDMKAPNGLNENAPGLNAWNNEHKLPGPDNADVFFVRSTDNAKGQWRAIQIDTQSIDVAIDLRLATSGNDVDWVQNRYQQTRGYYSAAVGTADGDWTNEIDSDAC